MGILKKGELIISTSYPQRSPSTTSIHLNFNYRKMDKQKLIIDESRVVKTVGSKFKSKYRMSTNLMRPSRDAICCTIFSKSNKSKTSMTCSLRILPKKQNQVIQLSQHSYMHFLYILPLEHKHLIYDQIFQNIGEDHQKLLLGEDGQQKFSY